MLPFSIRSLIAEALVILEAKQDDWKMSIIFLLVAMLFELESISGA
jgi:hypothetical protein